MRLKREWRALVIYVHDRPRWRQLKYETLWQQVMRSGDVGPAAKLLVEIELVFCHDTSTAER